MNMPVSLSQAGLGVPARPPPALTARTARHYSCRMIRTTTRAALFALVLIGAGAGGVTGVACAEPAPQQAVLATEAQAPVQTGGRGADLVLDALSMLGVRYHYGGEHRSTGFDCSGLVRDVYQRTLGLMLPHSAAQQSREGEKIAESQLRPGDLVFFHTLRRAFSHVGIYIGNGQFIHAPRRGQPVQIESMASPYWAHRFVGARRLIQQAADIIVPSAQAEPVPTETPLVAPLPPHPVVAPPTAPGPILPQVAP
ncbi:murein DD-endopeptidase MepH precursor [mine drainage metagenome]|uniref:Murein DD-endopeptidase MepH n=1 Tax=mine drainage metagenome TaxID=410659 RepID=A0A1J5R743_9ZZZZ